MATYSLKASFDYPLVRAALAEVSYADTDTLTSADLTATIVGGGSSPAIEIGDLTLSLLVDDVPTATPYVAATGDVLKARATWTHATGPGTVISSGITVEPIFTFDIYATAASEIEWTTNDTDNNLTLTISGVGSPYNDDFIVDSSDVADMAAGPVNILAPTLSESGGVITATPALWVNNAGYGKPATDLQWLADGAVIDGAEEATYTYNAATENGVTFTIVETATDTSGARSVVSSNSYTLNSSNIVATGVSSASSVGPAMIATDVWAYSGSVVVALPADEGWAFTGSVVNTIPPAS